MAYVTFPMPDDVRAYLIANCIVQLIAILVVAGRIVSRRIRRARLLWDDYLIIAAVPQGLTLVILQGITSTLGSGYHLSAAVMPNLEFILKLNFAFELIYLAALGTVKMSILFFYLRLFTRGTRMYRLTKSAMFVVGLWVCLHAVAVFMICQPIQLNWDITAEGACGDEIKLFESIIMTNIIVDALIWAMPLYTVWHLNVRRSDKVGLTACFLIGLAVIIAAIARVIYVTSVDVAGDITGTMPLTVFLAAFEPNLAITCACITMLRPLWAEFRGYVSTMRHSTALTEGGDHSAGGDNGFGRGSELKDLSSSSRHRPASQSAGAAREERRLRASHHPVGGLEGGGGRGAVGVSFGATAPLEAARTASLESGSEWDLVPGSEAPPARTRLRSKSRWPISKG